MMMMMINDDERAKSNDMLNSRQQSQGSEKMMYDINT